ncbi:MAG TPA: sigma-70 family RNA polymerase sigma factor [Polyangiales bacterium]
MAASVLQTELLAGLSEGELLAGLSAGEAKRSDAACGARVEPLVSLDVGAVYESHGAYVFRCLRGLGVRPSHVEDAVQDVFLVVNDKLAAFDGKAKLSTWLYAIVLRIARKYRARQASEGQTPSAEPLDSQDAEAMLMSREQLALAYAALNGLSDDKREVFVLAEIEQMSAPEIAAITFTPLNTVYSRLRAGRFEFERRIAQLSQRAAAIKSGRSR